MPPGEVYASNNPINDRDPSGLEEECIDWYVVTINVLTGEVIGERKLYTTCTKPGGGSEGGPGGPTQPTAQQYQYIECIATHWLSTGFTILSRLHSGRIFVTDHIPSNQNPNASMWTLVANPAQPIVIYGGAHVTNGGAFELSIPRFAYALGHEARHVARSDGTSMPRRGDRNT